MTRVQATRSCSSPREHSTAPEDTPRPEDTQPLQKLLSPWGYSTASEVTPHLEDNLPLQKLLRSSRTLSCPRFKDIDHPWSSRSVTQPELSHVHNMKLPSNLGSYGLSRDFLYAIPTIITPTFAVVTTNSHVKIVAVTQITPVLHPPPGHKLNANRLSPLTRRGTWTLFSSIQS